MQIISRLKKARLNAFRWIDALWGYDVFIAHRRSDSAGYAQGLYDALRTERISCFIDRVAYGPGDSLLLATNRHVAKSTVLFLVGSPQLLPPRQPIDWVEKEIETYLSTHSDPKLLLVDFGETISNALAFGTRPEPILDHLRPFLRISENSEALRRPPSENVLGAIRRNLNGRRRDRNRILFFEGVASLLMVMVIVVGGLALYANISLQRALLSQSQYLAEESYKATDAGNVGNGLLLALAALPNGDSQYPINRPDSTEATLALYKATQSIREIDTLYETDGARNGGELFPSKAIYKGQLTEVYKVKFSPRNNDPHVVTTSPDGDARLWDLNTRKSIIIGQKHLHPYDVDFSRHGNLIAIGCVDGEVYIFNRKTKTLMSALMSHPY